MAQPIPKTPCEDTADTRTVRRVAARAVLRVIADSAQQADASPEDAAIARRLYRATLALLRASDDPARDRHYLLAPFSQAVARQRTRAGQEVCAELATALAMRDYDAALDACLRLVELETASVDRRDAA